jgi:hypothetical protein
VQNSMSPAMFQGIGTRKRKTNLPKCVKESWKSIGKSKGQQPCETFVCTLALPKHTVMFCFDGVGPKLIRECIRYWVDDQKAAGD